MYVKIAISKYVTEKKLAPGSPEWSRFNSGFENTELEADMILQNVYDGHAITTQHKDHWRQTQNYICGQHLGLDFDAGDKTSSLAYLMKDKFVLKYAAFLYSTISHTAEHPKSRVIFLLDTPIMQAQNYTLAAAALLWLYGTADRQCKDAVRFFYGSLKCECEFLNNILPMDVIQKLIAEYQETGRAERKQVVKKDYLAPPSHQEVQEALRFIPPWQVDYTEWVEILMGLHSEFGSSGLMLAERWADGKPGEVEQKWRSFHDGQVSGITIATVFSIAKRFGWNRVRKETT